jgi:uncharacterized protein (TIGR00297 family)
MPSPPARLTWAETRRKLAHMAAFWPALCLPWLSPAQALGVTFLLLIMNVFILPKAARGLYRDLDPGRGELEIILYPAALMACVIAFGASSVSSPSGAGMGKPAWYLPVMAAWFALACVDACIGFACRLLPIGPALPWNTRKPALAVALGAAAAFSLAWLLIHGLGGLPAGSAGLWTAVALFIAIAALAETAWFGIADNLVVPFSVCVLAPLIPNPAWVAHELPWLPWYLASAPAAFGILAYAAGLLTLGGSLLGAFLSLLLMLANPWLFAFLCGFFALGNLATRFGAARKRALGIAEARGGRRGAAEVFGAMGMAAWMTPLAHAAGSVAPAGGGSRAALLVCLAPLVAKTMDTVSSEIGKAIGGRTISLRSFRPVPPGDEGGVSVAGTLAGLAAAGAMALAILPLGWGGPPDVGALMIFAVAANLFESYWGEWAARKGLEAGAHTNVLMTLAAAVPAWLWWFTAS